VFSFQCSTIPGVVAANLCTDSMPGRFLIHFQATSAGLAHLSLYALAIDL